MFMVPIPVPDLEFTVVTVGGLYFLMEGRDAGNDLEKSFSNTLVYSGSCSNALSTLTMIFLCKAA